MKNLSRTFIKVAPLLAAVLLCGALLDRAKGPMPLLEGTTLSEKQAIWSRFIGYGPEAYATRFSAFNQGRTLVIAQQAKKLMGIQTDTGWTRWHQSMNRHTFTNPASINATKVFIGTSEPKLLALDVNTGELVWSASLSDTTLASVAADQHQVFIKTSKGEVIALDEKSGAKLWQYKHPATVMTLKTSSAPKISGDKVLVGFPNGQLIALNRTTGELIWKDTVATAKSNGEFDALVDIAADPLVDENGTVYVGTYQGKLKALSLATGDTKWERLFSGYMPLVLKDQLYSLDSDDVLHAFDKTNGNILWSQTVFKEYKKSKADYQVTGPVLTGDGKQLVIADSIGNLYWLALSDGRIMHKASFTITSPIVTPPLAQASTVYAINRRSQMAAWDITQHQSIRVENKENFPTVSQNQKI